MERIATATKSVDLFGAGKHGFTDGNPPGGTPPTQFSALWCNAVQESIVLAMEDVGLTPGVSNYQLAQAMATYARHVRPRGISAGSNYTTVRSDTTNDIRDDWYEWKRLGGKLSAADNSTHSIVWTADSAEFDNSQFTIEAWASCVSTTDIDVYSNAHLRGSGKKVGGVATLQDFEVAYVAGSIAVDWELFAAGGTPSVRVLLPVAGGALFNIGATVILRNVSRI